MKTIKYQATRTNRQHTKESGKAKIVLSGDEGIVIDIHRILKRKVDGWNGEFDTIKIIKEERFYVTNCPSNESCWKYVVKDRELDHISVAVFGLKSQAEKYCKFLNDDS